MAICENTRIQIAPLVTIMGQQNLTRSLWALIMAWS